MGKIIGIDLGTTNSLVATVRSGLSVVLNDESGRPLLPSVIRYAADGSFEAGYEADAVVLDDTALPHPQELTVRERVERALYLSGECRVTQKYVAGKAIL